MISSSYSSGSKLLGCTLLQSLPGASEYDDDYIKLNIGKGKGLPQQAEVAQGVLGRLRPRISLTFGTTRVVGRQPYASAAFTPGESPKIKYANKNFTNAKLIKGVH